MRNRNLVRVTLPLRNCTPTLIRVNQVVRVTQGGGGGGTKERGIGGEEHVDLEEARGRTRLWLATALARRVGDGLSGVVGGREGLASRTDGGLEGGGERELAAELVPALRDELLGLRALELARDPLHGSERGEGLAGPL